VIYLSNELALLQLERQRYDTSIAQLNAAASQQDAAATEARTRATAARAEAGRLNLEAATFYSQAAAWDAEVARLDGLIADKIAAAPDRFIEVRDGVFQANPAWPIWKSELDALQAQRPPAVAAAATARTNAAQRVAASQPWYAQAQTADAQEAAAKANAQKFRQDAAALEPARNAIIQQVDTMLRWQQEIAREPMNRAAAEGVARELSARLDALESEQAAALDLAATADARQLRLQTLVQELTGKIAAANVELPVKAAAIAAATTRLPQLQTEIRRVMLLRRTREL
jgi:hypothetical protein